MVSEPNFVLGIKQTSLANKEDSHVHTTIRSHTYFSIASRLHSILQPSWLTAVFRSSSPSNPCLSLLDLCTSRLRLSKPIPQTCSLAFREENPKIRSTESKPRAEDSFGKSPTRRLRFLTSDRLLGTRAALKASTCTDLLGLRIWRSYDGARASTRHQDFRHLLHAPVALARAFHAPKHCC